MKYKSDSVNRPWEKFGRTATKILSIKIKVTPYNINYQNYSEKHVFKINRPQEKIWSDGNQKNCPHRNKSESL